MLGARAAKYRTCSDNTGGNEEESAASYLRSGPDKLGPSHATDRATQVEEAELMQNAKRLSVVEPDAKANPSARSIVPPKKKKQCSPGALPRLRAAPPESRFAPSLADSLALNTD